MHVKSPRPPRGWAVLFSLALHALFAAGVLTLAVRGLEKEEAREIALAAQAAAVELPPRSEPGLVDVEPWTAPVGVPPSPAGGARVARLDTGRAGAGGESAQDDARHLADRDDGLSATPESTTLHRDDQVQRLHTARDRSSWEDRRSTTRPMELSFVVTGKGRETERRPNAEVDPSRGALTSRPSQTEGQTRPAENNEGEGALADPGGRAAPGVGTRTGREGAAHRIGALVTVARPDLPMAKPTIPAAERGKVRDDVDSRQAVASAVDAIVHSSYTGGESGAGRGGSQGGGAPGAGGAAGAGSHPRPLGAGAGDWVDFDTSDPALAGYFRRLKAKMKPALADAFPKQAALDLKQGFVIVEMVIARSGAIEAKLVRPSGVEEYDRNCLVALRGLPPEPLPSSVAQPSLRVRGRFEAANPVIK